MHHVQGKHLNGEFLIAPGTVHPKPRALRKDNAPLNPERPRYPQCLVALAYARPGSDCKSRKKGNNFFKTPFCHCLFGNYEAANIFFHVSFDRNNSLIFKPPQSSIELNYIAVGLLNATAVQMLTKRREADELQI